MWRSLFWLFLIAALSASAVLAFGCDDDDDDDDNDDNDDADDDDDDNFNSTDGSVLGTCIAYYIDCFGMDAGTAEEICQELLDIEQTCAPGATERLFECTGADCSLWEACTHAWEDEVNC